MRNESRAAKVSLMKIKMKATGDVSIPQVCGLIFSSLEITVNVILAVLKKDLLDGVETTVRGLA